ncbi:hypothetical protein JNB91_09895 [Rhizobium wenxiniae]|uniref:hypothetical protein n=1 Tax=Rhizobium wenxiniae TaxID=1737357 RepID=UPI001C6E75A5|nr:hypothetical protein [Rhizobium wenxiniae]MBW9088154.1 hypothetical protein [Rhizobium wenxiniae]
MAKSGQQAPEADQKKLLELLLNTSKLESDDLKSLLLAMDNFDVVAKVFLLEGTPFVFASSPMKYLIFREQVADRFKIGYQDVCIVGSAKLGFSPSPQKFGKPFAETSDVDVVIISSEMFDHGTHEMFKYLRTSGPEHTYDDNKAVEVGGREWRMHKEAIRNFVFENFNPSHLPEGNELRDEIFDNISSTSALFLALEPQVFVSKIRCRIFRHWRAAESYYVNTLRSLKRNLQQAGKGKHAVSIADLDDDLDAVDVETP